MSDKAMSLADARSQATKASDARKRLTALFDPDSFVEIGALVKAGGETAGVVTGYGMVEGAPVYAFSQDSSVKSGAVGAAHGGKIKKIYELALKTGAPVVGVYDSNGAALEEGLDALAAYGEMLCQSNNLSGVVPQISLVLGVCAGSAAMMAASADFVVMSEQGEFFLNAGDADASSADNALKMGVAHIVEKNEAAAIKSARRLLALLPSNNLAASPICDFTEDAGCKAALEKAATDPTALFDGIAKLVDAGSLVELQKGFAPGCGARIGLATMAGTTVGVICASENGKLCSNGASKVARFAAICDSFQIPVVTFVNCEKFASSAPHGFKGGVREIAKLAHVYAEITAPKIAVVTGQAYGSAFVALAGRGANADYVLAWPNASIGALSPATAVAFLKGEEITAKKTREQVEKEYAANVCSPVSAAAAGHLDDVVEPAATRRAVLSALDMLAAKRVNSLPKKHANIPM